MFGIFRRIRDLTCNAVLGGINDALERMLAVKTVEPIEINPLPALESDDDITGRTLSPSRGRQRKD